MNARARRHATRAAAREAARPESTVSMMRGSGLTKRAAKSGTKLTATQRNSIGRKSEWSASPEFFTDPKWSYTATVNKAV